MLKNYIKNEKYQKYFINIYISKNNGKIFLKKYKH
jgi:hypothetical protein